MPAPPGRCGCFIAYEVPGTLTYSFGETAVLETYEVNEDLSRLLNRGVYEYRIVLGVDYSGTRITLQDVFITNRKSGLTGISITRFHVNRIYVGTHFETEADVQFDRVEFAISNLWEWAQLSGIQRKVTPDSRGRPHRFHIEYEAPVPIEAEIDDGRHIRIKSSSSFSLEQSKDVQISETTILEIRSEVPRAVDEFMNDAFVFSSFISLGLSTPTYTYEVRGFSPHLFEQIDEQRRIPTRVDVLFQPMTVPEFDRKVPFHKIAFTYGAIKHRFPQMVRGWYRQFAQLEAPLQLYFSTISCRQLPLDQRFMNLTEAFESIHRGLFGGEYVPRKHYLEGMYRDFLNAIPPDTDEDFRESLRTRLKYHNEYSLRKRIKSCILAEQRLFPGLDGDGFAARVTDTRNFYAHRTPELQEGALAGSELYQATVELNRIIRVMILRAIGFSDPELESNMKQ
jgi:hypothetical protein